MHSAGPLRRAVRAAATAAMTVAVAAQPALAADPSLSLVRDIRPASGGSNPQELTAIGRWDTGVTLYFSANDGTSGRELWKSDTTGVGTKR